MTFRQSYCQWWIHRNTWLFSILVSEQWSVRAFYRESGLLYWMTKWVNPYIFLSSFSTWISGCDSKVLSFNPTSVFKQFFLVIWGDLRIHRFSFILHLSIARAVWSCFKSKFKSIDNHNFSHLLSVFVFVFTLLLNVICSLCFYRTLITEACGSKAILRAGIFSILELETINKIWVFIVNQWLWMSIWHPWISLPHIILNNSSSEF